MFTGIIEAKGEIVQITSLADGGARLMIQIPFASELTLGESVAVNGCCLTVTEVNAQNVAFDLLQQTLNVTNLGQQKTGSVVNLERAVLPTSRLSGHLVQGHVDETAEVLAIKPQGQDTMIVVQLPESARGLVISRGSIAVDGISLTIAELEEGQFTLWIIPHTLEVTNLGSKQPGDQVNLEFDLLGKYVQRQLALRGSDA
ncbi:MAG: riboflavin synthase [Verrucomicrobiales bacterium]|jgi:riboflavin synthase